jgi:LacI family transcriptional regulator
MIEHKSRNDQPGKDQKTVGVVFSDPFLRGLLRDALAEHARRYSLPWWVIGRPSLSELYYLTGGDGLLGVVGRFRNEPIPDEWVARGICFLLCQPGPHPNTTSIWFDDQRTGALAAEHLWQRGWRQAACLRARRIPSDYRLAREAGFIARWRELGGWCSELRFPESCRNEADNAAYLQAWLQTTPRPLAVFAYQDMEALWFSLLCQRIGLKPGRDLGLIGCDDGHEAAAADPPLSSVCLPWRFLAGEAGLCLQRHISGQPVRPITIRPLLVRARASTLFIPTDPILQRFLSLLNQPRARHLRVSAVTANLGISLDTLTRRCQGEWGRTPADLMRHHRLERARTLLIDEPDTTVTNIARRCGWCHAAHLARDFRQQYGCTPAQFRIIRSVDRDQENPSPGTCPSI